MLFTWKNFMFSDFAWKKVLLHEKGGGAVGPYIRFWFTLYSLRFRYLNSQIQYTSDKKTNSIPIIMQGIHKHSQNILLLIC